MVLATKKFNMSEYQKRYYAKLTPEQKAERARKTREWYANQTPEQRVITNARARKAQLKQHRAMREAMASRPRPDCCEVCQRNGRIHWDHSHETGRFRGWICFRCNAALGLVGDNRALLLKLHDYLTEAEYENGLLAVVG